MAILCVDDGTFGWLMKAANVNAADYRMVEAKT